MSSHSTLLGGSIAQRRISCPASFREQLKAPPGVTSEYAEHGTAMHDAMTFWFEHPSQSTLVGLKFNDHTVTQEDFDTLLQPAMRALDELELEYSENFSILDTERPVTYPGIPGAHGTLDYLADSDTHLLLVDFKFGAGVQVTAADVLGNPNAQLMFYLGGVKRFIKDRTVVVAIIQPTFEPHCTHLVVTPAMMRKFEKDVMRAVKLALSDNPPRARGDWCRFAPCKTTCPLWTGPLLDLSAIGLPKWESSREHDEWGVFLANAKRLIDSALIYSKQIDAALIDHLQAGRKAPGFALKPKATTRKWLDDAQYVANALARLGLNDNEIWQHKLQTFQVVDAAAKRRGAKIPDSLRPKPPATELTLTYEDDPQRVDVVERKAKFIASLKLISKNGG